MFGVQPGQMIDEYKIISKVGKGGMATVYKAYQASMDRFVAIKILSFQLVDNEEFLGRFKQEARMIARLEHPNILPVYAYGEDRGIPFLVMRFLDAGTLKDYLRQKLLLQKTPSATDRMPPFTDEINLSAPSYPPLSMKEIDSIFSQVADALSYAHENGVIHRDIKPSNVMLDRRGTTFLTDFGIAKLIETTGDGEKIFRNETVPQFTATGAITGTPDYMSPEQAQGLRIDQRSDIYSLGIVLFELLTGKVPFEAETPMAVIMKQIAEPLPPPSLINPNLHPALEAVVLKALEKDTERRYFSMHEFLAAWKNAYAVAALYTTSNSAEVSVPAEELDSGLMGRSLSDDAQTPFEASAPLQQSTPVPVVSKKPAAGSLHGFEEEPYPEQPSADSGKKLNLRMNRTEEEHDQFLLKNLQMSKTTDQTKPHNYGKEHHDGGVGAGYSEYNAEHRNHPRLLFIAGGIALFILAIIGLSAGLQVFDFIRINRPTTVPKQSVLSSGESQVVPSKAEEYFGFTSWAASNNFQAFALYRPKEQSGLFIYAGGAGGITVWQLNPSDSGIDTPANQITTQDGLPSGWVTALALDDGVTCEADADGGVGAGNSEYNAEHRCLWVGTDHGIAMVKEPSGKTKEFYDWVIYDEADGLDSAAISALKIKDGILWAGSQYSRAGGGLQFLKDGQWQHVDDFPSVEDPDAQSVSYNVQQILVDDNNRLWVATQDGLVMRDASQVLGDEYIEPNSGRAWKVFKTEQGLPHNDVLSLYQDKDGVIWAGTRDGGAASFDGTSFITMPDLREKDIYDVTSILQDETGAMWFIGYNAARFDPQNSDWQTFSLSNGTFPYDNLRLAGIDDQTGDLFITSDGNGIVQFSDLLSLKQLDFQVLALSNVPRFSGYSRILQAPPGYGNRLIFINSNGGDLDVFDKGTGDEYIAGDLNKGTWLPPTAFTCQTESCWPTVPTPRLFDSQGQLWAGEWDGLWLVSENDFTVWRQEEGLPSNHVTSIALPPGKTASAENPAWIGTEAGLAVFDGEKITAVYDTSNSGLRDNEVSQLLITSDGSVWACNGTTISLRLLDGSWTGFSTDTLTGSSAWISDIAEDLERTIWISTHDGGLLHYQDGKWENIRSSDPGVDLPSDRINSITVAADGSIWFGMDHAGASRYEAAPGTEPRWTNYLEGLIDPSVHDIYVENNVGGAGYSASNVDAHNEAVWFATDGGITAMVVGFGVEDNGR